MNTLIIYESLYGNTEKIARKIADTLQEFGAARVARVTEAKPQDVETVDLLIVGCPTQAWHTTPATQNFIKELSRAHTAHLCVAPFDTRFDKPGWLTGSAARGMVKQLRRLDVTLVMAPESFLVQGTEGPLAMGELERASEWARQLHDEFEEQMEPIAVPM